MDFDFPDAVRFNNAYHNLLDIATGNGGNRTRQPQPHGRRPADCRRRILQGLGQLPLYKDIFVNQWAFAVGSQLTRGQTKYRLAPSV